MGMEKTRVGSDKYCLGLRSLHRRSMALEIPHRASIGTDLRPSNRFNMILGLDELNHLHFELAESTSTGVAMAASMAPGEGPAPASMKQLPSKRAQASKVRRVSWKVRVVTPDGNSEIVQWSKQEFMRRSGLPARDLRPNGPLLSAAATILGKGTLSRTPSSCRFT